MSKRARSGAGYKTGYPKRSAGKHARFAAATARMTRGRYAGISRKVGYYGRYPGAGTMAPTELKFHDIDWDEAAADQSAGKISNTTSLVLIGQGITESTRIGRKAVIKSIGWRGRLTLSAFAGSTVQLPNVVRMMLVHDTQCNGAAPAVTGSGGVLVQANYQAFNELVNKGRYRVLMDKTYSINARAAAGDGAVNDSGSTMQTFSFYKKCDIPIEYSGTADPAAITEVRTNNIFGIMITSASTANIALDSKFRFRFLDG